jgi:hypothetical protein
VFSAYLELVTNLPINFSKYKGGIMFEKKLITNDSQQQRNERREVKFRDKKPRMVFISPQVIGAKNQLRKCAPPLGIASLAAVLEEDL